MYNPMNMETLHIFEIIFLSHLFKKKKPLHFLIQDNRSIISSVASTLAVMYFLKC